MDEQQLLDLYKIAVEEYRFQVRFNWDRNKFYILLDSSLISLAVGLLKIPGKQSLELLMVPLFIAGILIALIGLVTLTKGHEYYRRTVLKMAQLESQLGLASEKQPITTTAGMRESKTVLSDPDSFVKRPFRLGTTTYFLAGLFVFLIIANVFGILLVFSNQFLLTN